MWCVCVCDTTGSGTPEAIPELLERSGLRDARDIAPSVACVTMTSLEACPQRAATPFDTFPPLGCSYLTCKVFSSLPGSHAIISAAEPASFLSKGLPRNMKSWETLVAARWHTRRPGVACPAGSDPWLVPPCIAPFSRSLGRCVSATSPFLSATGASGDHPMIKQRSQRARAVIFVDRVPRAGKRSKGFGSLPLPPPLLYTPHPRSC